MSKRIFFSSLIIIYCFMVNLFVGFSDVGSLTILMATAILIRPVVLEFQMGGRQLMATHFADGSQVKEIIKKPGVIVHFFAVATAVVLAFGLIVMIKGVIISHGLFSFLVFLSFVTFIFFPILGRASQNGRDKSQGDEEALAEKHLAEPAAKYASFVAYLLIGVLLLNVFMATALSAKDTYSFLSSDVTYDSVGFYAQKSAIPARDGNYASMVVINAYVVADAFKMALANNVFSEVFKGGDKASYFYLFYAVVFLGNLVKLTPLAIGIVFFFRGVRRHSDAVQAWTEIKLQQANPFLQKVAGLLRDRLANFKKKDQPQEDEALNEKTTGELK